MKHFTRSEELYRSEPRIRATPLFVMTPELIALDTPGVTAPSTVALPFPMVVLEAQEVTPSHHSTFFLIKKAHDRGVRFVSWGSDGRHIHLVIDKGEVHWDDTHCHLVAPGLKAAHDTEEEYKATRAYIIRRIEFFLKLLSTKGIIHENVEPPAKLNKKRLASGKPAIAPYIRLVGREPGETLH